MTAACLPLYVLRFRLVIPTTLLEVLIGVTAVGYVATLWSEKRRPPIPSLYIVVPVVLLLIAGLIGIAKAPDHTRALGIYRAYFVEAVLIFYIAIDLLRTPDEVRAFLGIAAIGACGMAIGQIVVFTDALIHHTLQLGDAPAFLNTSPNADSMYLELPLGFALGFALFASRPSERRFAIVVLALVLIANVVTLSRASYLSMGALAIVVVLSMRSRRWRLWAVGAVAALGLLILEVPFVNQRFLDLAHSVTNRTYLYSETLRMLRDHPLFGGGISGFPVAIAPYRPASLVVQLYPHDLWLTTWSELGLLGLLTFAVIFFGLLFMGARSLARASGIWRPLLWGGVAGLVLYTVHGLFDSPYWKNDLSVEFWLLAALVVVGVRAVGGWPLRSGDAALPKSVEVRAA